MNKIIHFLWSGIHQGSLNLLILCAGGGYAHSRSGNPSRDYWVQLLAQHLNLWTIWSVWRRAERLLGCVEHKPPRAGFESTEGFSRKQLEQHGTFPPWWWWFPWGTKDLIINHIHCPTIATLPPTSRPPNNSLLTTCLTCYADIFSNPPLLSLKYS